VPQRLLSVSTAVLLYCASGEWGTAGTTAAATAPGGVEAFGTIRIGRGEKRQVKFEAPPTPAGREAVLAFRARIEFKEPVGYTHALRLILNGTTLDGAPLVNKRLSEERVNGGTQGMAAGDLLTVPYAPDFDSTDRHPSYAFKRVRACDFDLRVTDVLKPGANALVLEKTVGTGNLAVVVGNGRIEFRASTGPLPEFAPAALRLLPDVGRWPALTQYGLAPEKPRRRQTNRLSGNVL